MRLPVGHFLDDEAESTDAFLFLKVLVLGLEGGGRGEEEGIIGGAGGGRALGEVGEEGRIGTVDGERAVGPDGGRGGRRGGTGRGGDGVLGEGKVVLVLDPRVDAGVAGGGGVGEELREEGRVRCVVFGHGHFARRRNKKQAGSTPFYSPRTRQKIT